MKPGSFLGLAALTVIAVIAAAVTVFQQRALTTFAGDRERAFATLADRLNDAVKVEIVSNEARFALVRNGEEWGLEDRARYPVHYDKIKRAIVGLAELKLLEAKTSDPARHERLQVNEPDAEAAGSVRFAVKDSAGGVLAEGVLGKQNPNLFGESGGGTYLRRGKEAQAWLAEGEAALGKTRNDWLIRDIVDIDAEAVRRAVIRQPDGARIVVRQDKEKDGAFTLDGIPEGRKLKDSGEAKNLAGGLWRLTFEDVKPAADIAFPPRFNTAEYETLDGLKVRVEMTVVDEVVWGRFSASAEGAAGEAAEAAGKKAAAINRRAKGWIYELSAGEGEKLTTRIEDILEKPAKNS